MTMRHFLALIRHKHRNKVIADALILLLKTIILSQQKFYITKINLRFMSLQLCLFHTPSFFT